MIITFFQKIKRKIKALKIRYSKNQEYIFKTKFKFKLKLNVKRDVDKAFYLDIFEKTTLNLFSELVNPEQVIIDVGANIGIYTLIASKRLGMSGKVYAFEPSDWAYNRLMENISLNSFKNIETIKKAVSDYSGQTEFYVCEDDAYNSIGAKPMKEVTYKKTVDVITLDEFCKQKKIDKVDLIKIDTEGADYLVLKGSNNLLKNVESPIILCEYNRYTKANDNFELNDMLILLDNLGYKIFELNNNRLVRFNSLTSKVDEIICLKNNHYSRIPLVIEE